LGGGQDRAGGEGREGEGWLFWGREILKATIITQTS
jgi:hypothetical protein